MHESIKEDDYLIRITSAEDEKQLKVFTQKYKYTNIFSMEIDDPEFYLKERIMGASVRILFKILMIGFTIYF